jgi:photosystem II stability/assembly factor-like uncharacterized protein
MRMVMKVIMVLMVAVFFSTSAAQIFNKSPWITDRNLYSVSFYDNQTGWIGGRNGLILKTTDGGTSWRKIETNYSDAYFSDIKVFDSQNIFARIRQGYFLNNFTYSFTVSTDGGESWSDLPLPDTSVYKFMDIWAFNKDSLIGVGKDSLIASSTDGGMNWNIIQHAPQSGLDLYKIFYKGSTGWISGHKPYPDEQNTFYRTTDNINWVKTADFFAPITFSFSDENTGYAFTYYEFYKSTDGGISWEELPFPLLDIAPTAILAQGDTVYTATGYFPGESNTPSLWISTDSGINWVPTMYFDRNFEIYGINILSGGKMFICGQHGYIAESSDGLKFKPLMGDFVTGVYAFNNEVFVTGFDENILRTTDDGSTWLEIPTGIYGIKEIMFADSNTGFISMIHQNTVLKTVDRGNSWAQVNYPVNKIIQTMDNDGGIYGYEVTGYEYQEKATRFKGIYRSYDLGDTWIKLMDLNYYHPYIFPLDSVNIWIRIGDSSYVTTDGGNNWTTVNYPVYPFEFLTADSGIGMSYTGMKYTSDGGMSWHDVHNNLEYFRHMGLAQHKFFNKDYAFFLYQDHYLPIEDETLYPFIFDKYLKGDTSEIIMYTGKIISSFSFDNNFNAWFAAGRNIYKVIVDPVITGGASEVPSPLTYELRQNHPNPFNPITKIIYSIPRPEYVTLKIYDIIGREIATLIKGEVKAGTYYLEFSAGNLSSGTYFYRITAGEFTETKKMQIIK